MHSWAIETQNLSRSFGTHRVVDRVELRVPTAGVYGFLGPNGAGKTTTIRMLLGLIRPAGGEVRLFGSKLLSQRQKLVQRVGALVETPSLYPHLTGRENLEVTRRLLGARTHLVDRALEIVKLSGDSHRCVREYSLGMRQRLGLALALLNEPELLILDEPTNGLDPAGIHEMRTLLRSLAADFGITVFLSSHLLSEVELIAQHIGIIHLGRLLFQGTLSELQSRHCDRIAIGLTRPTEALEVLRSNGWAAQQREDGMLSVSTGSRDDAARINTLLVQRGFAISHLSRTQVSLEDIFLTLTNRTAGD